MSKTIKLSILLIASMLTTNLSATYYIAGNGADDTNENWCNGSNWGFNALNGENSVTFESVAAGNYGFKIKDADNWETGSEYTTIDYDNSDSPMYGGNGSDVCFSLSEEANVTVSVVDGKIILTATKPLAYRSNYYYIAGNCEAFGKSGSDWSPNSVALTNDQISFTALPAEWYEFKITNGSWSKTWGYSELDVVASSPMHQTYGTGNNICFRLTEAADVTVKMINNKVVLLIDREYCIIGNGSGTWLNGQDWGSHNDAAKLDANLSRTYYNLPAGSYQFKIKDNVDAWSANDDCTWGFSHLDTDNSNIGEDWSSNIGFNLDRPADVTIAIVNNKIRANASPVYFIAGNGAAERGDWCNQKDWWTDEPNSRLDATTLSKTYTALPAGEYEFKLTNGNWASDGGTVWDADDIDAEHSSKGYMGANNEDNIKFHLQAPTDVTISFNPETGKISLTNPNGYFLCNVYSVVGDEALTGSNWNNMETSTEMTAKGDGTYEFLMSDKQLEAGDYSYKIIGGHSWGKGCEYPTSNATLSITEAGTYDVLFTFNPVTEEQTCIATPKAASSLDITISAYQFNTFYAAAAYEVPDGLQAFIYTGISGDMLVMESIDVIPALTGVVLYGAANTVYTLPATQTDVTYPANLLKGTLTDETINNSKVHYILSLKDGQVGLYWPYNTTDGVGSFTNHAGKAYLELAPAAAKNIRGFILRGTNGTTAIDNIATPQTDEPWYDLLGRPVEQPTQSGVYIRQGKKVVVF